MIFWLIAGALTVVALGFGVLPLLWRKQDPTATPPRGAYDIAVYRDQLVELETALKLEEISKADAATARLEIERRILRAAAANQTAPKTAAQQKRPWLLATMLTIFITALGFGLYSQLGSPNMPGHPYVYHEDDEIALAKGQKETLETLVEKLIAHLQEHSDDTEGWMRLRKAMAALDDSPRAAQLMQKAVAAHPNDINLRVMYGESLIAMSNGQVTPAAKLAFEEALKLAPNHPGAQYYLALAAFQNDDMAAAYKGWAAIVAQSPPDAPWVPQVKARMREAAARLDGDSTGATAPIAENGPTADQRAAAEAMSPAQRAAMIRGMVQKLADRLKSTPNDYQGWHRLGRAYGVLGEKEKALAALKQALKAAPTADQAAIERDISSLQGRK